MSEETLFTAARRVVRYFNIDMNKGGIIAVSTQQAIETLSRMVTLVQEAEKRGYEIAFVKKDDKKEATKNGE